MIKVKTAAQMKKENEDAAKAVPVDDKKKFWDAMVNKGLTLGEARKIIGLDIMVAAALVCQLHFSVNIPMRVDDIK